MIHNIMRLVALWRPPQRAEGGKLLPDQIEIDEVHFRRKLDGTVIIEVSTWEPLLGDPMNASVEITPALIAEKKAALGHHVVTSLTDGFIAAVAAHPRAHEATPFHHHMRPR